MEKAVPKEVIDIDALSEQAMQMYLALEGLRQETKDAWQKLAKLLAEVIEVNNKLGIRIKKAVMSQREEIMDGRVAANRVCQAGYNHS